MGEVRCKFLERKFREANGSIRCNASFAFYDLANTSLWYCRFLC